MTTQPASVDPGELLKKQALLLNYSIGANAAAMIYLGIEMGLYAALRDHGPATSDELASHTGFHERWLREWLRQQAAAKVLDYDRDDAAPDSGRFSISPETALVLADPDELRTMISNFAGLTYRFGMLDRLPEAFRTGIGIQWDDRGPRGPEATEALFRNWYKHQLVQFALPAIDGIVPRLEAGVTVADVGCGSGLAMIAMAKAFPHSDFHGYEASRQAIARGATHMRDAGITNVAFHDVSSEPLPTTATYDLICTFDCLHDMTRPDNVANAIRRAIRDDGVWLIADINGQPTFEQNLDANPLAAMFYAVSVISCMSSAMSEEGGAGYGTLGLPEPTMRDLVISAGFTRFKRLDLQHPFNAFYEVRV